MSQVWRRFERTIVSRVIVFCDFDRVFRVSIRLQLIKRFVIAMQQDETGALFLFHQDLTEIKWRSKAVENFLNQICHCWGATSSRADLMEAMSDQTACPFEKLQIFVIEGIQFIAIGIEHTENVPVVVAHWHNNLGTSCMECR